MKHATAVSAVVLAMAATGASAQTINSDKAQVVTLSPSQIQSLDMARDRGQLKLQPNWTRAVATLQPDGKLSVRCHVEHSPLIDTHGQPGKHQDEEIKP